MFNSLGCSTTTTRTSRVIVPSLLDVVRVQLQRADHIGGHVHADRRATVHVSSARVESVWRSLMMSRYTVPTLPLVSASSFIVSPTRYAARSGRSKI